MSALQSLRTALGSLGRNPALFLAGLAYALVLLPQSALQLAGVPLAPTVFQFLTFFVTPFLIAGTIGMAAEAIDGDTSLSTLTRVGKDRYVPLLVAKFVELAVLVGYAIVGGIAAVVAAVAGFAVGVPLVALAVGELVLLGLALVFFFVQFYPVAVTVDDAGAVDGFRASIRLVRENLLSALGYSVISFLVSVAVALPVSGPIYYRVFQNLERIQDMQQGGVGPGPGGMPGGMGALQFSTQEVLLLSVISVAVTMLVFAFSQTYATAFYRDHAPRTGAARTDRPAGAGVDAAGPGAADAGRGTADATDADGWSAGTSAGTRADTGVDDRTAGDRSEDRSNDRSRDDRF